MGLPEGPPQAFARRRALHIVFSLLVTASFAWWLIPARQAAEIADALTGARPAPVAFALLLVVAGQWARGWRLALLVAPVKAAWLGGASFRLYRLSVIHNFLASVIPARLGEISLVVLLRRHYGVPAMAGAGILLGIRTLDLLLLTAIGGVAGWMALPVDGGWAWLRSACGVAGVVSAVSFLLLPHAAPRLSGLLNEWHGRHGGRLSSIPAQVMAAYAGLTPRRIVGLQVATGAIWLALMACYHLCALAVGAVAGLAATLLASVAASYAFVSPINGIAQIGPFEAAWTYAAMAAGEDYAIALASAVLVHLVTFGGGALQAAIVLPFGRPRPSTG